MPEEYIFTKSISKVGTSLYISIDRNMKKLLDIDENSIITLKIIKVTEKELEKSIECTVY